MAFEEIKQKQVEIIEHFGTLTTVIKNEIINIVEKAPIEGRELDQAQYRTCVKSPEHPEGFFIEETDHPLIRISKGKIIDTYFWTTANYCKFRKKSVAYKIGLWSVEGIENYVILCGKITDVKDREKFTQKLMGLGIGEYLEVLETPEEVRKGVEVTAALLAELPEMLESYNNTDEWGFVRLEEGDLLVKEDDTGFYYRVEKKIKDQTYTIW